ncbi:MAG: hypothetical protein A2W80_09530 [Candidatus Riflebacteria bacterium GWC2_50_8]|nr:MAG: hypothetical protein A2W80_09530 [Candidatus Riflebacteria bacterium GWC2_50_8]
MEIGIDALQHTGSILFRDCLFSFFPFFQGRKLLMPEGAITASGLAMGRQSLKVGKIFGTQNFQMN